MTESTEATSAPSLAPQKTSFWEDVIEIFIHPADVMRRRADTSVWPPMLFVTLAIGIITFATFNSLAPMFEAEYSRNMVKAMAKNPQMTQEMADKGRDIFISFAKYTFPVIILVTMFLLGIFTWLVAKLVGAKTGFQQALVVAAWAYFPRVIGSILAGVQGLLMDSAKLTSQFSISLSPARFMDVETANPLLFQLAGRFDLLTIWVTILLAVGIYVTGGISKQRAIVFGVLIFIVGALPAIRNGYMLM